ITEEDLNLLLSRDGAPPKIVGITPPYENPLRFVRRVDKSRLADEVSLELPSVDLIDEISQVGAQVVAFTTDRAFDAEDLYKIAKAKPKAMRLSLSINSVSGITAFDSLEALHINSYNTSRTSGGVVQETTTDAIQLSRLPKVRDLSLFAVPFNETMGQSLVEHGNLRLFNFVMVSGSSTIENPPTWEGIDQLAETMEGLRVDYGLRLPGDDIFALTRLRHLSNGPSMLPPSDHKSFSVPDSGEMIILEIRAPKINGAALRSWAEAGLLKKVERLSTYQLADMSLTPKVEFLYMSGRSDSKSRTKLSQVTPLENLRLLSCFGLLDEDLQTLASLPTAPKLEVLILKNSKATTLNSLTTLTRLRRLELPASEMQVSEINLGIFPRLESLQTFDLPKLNSLTGAMSHPLLASIALRNSPEFNSLGLPAENTTLRHLHFEKLTALDDLSPLETSTGITQLRITGCSQIEDIRFLERNNPLVYLSIYQNRHLEDRSTSDLVR
ncbi:MAG: hypothetical protein AAGA96_07145, partial [Verrucomicrobiota bacterium]